MSALGRTFPLRERSGMDFQLLAPVFSTVIVAMLWWMGLRPFVSQMAGDLGLSVPLVGQVATLAALLTALAGLFTGPVADHYGHRRSIVLGLSLLATSAAVYALAPNLPLMALGGIVGGLGMAMTYGVAFAVISTHFTGDERRRAVGMTQAVASLAVVAGPPALVAVAAMTHWRGSFLVMSAALVAAAALAAKYLPPDAQSEGWCASPRRILANYRPLIAAAPVRMLYIVSMLRSVTVGGLAVYLGAYYFDIVGFSAREVGIALMLDGTGQMLGSLAGGGRLGSFDPRRTFAFGTAYVGICALTIYTIQPVAVAIVAIAISMSFVAGVTFTSLTAMLASETPVGAATTMVLNISMIAVGAALGSAIGGALIGLAGYPTVGLAALAISMTAALLILAPGRLLDRAAPVDVAGQIS